MRFPPALPALLLTLLPAGLGAQTRSMAQDSTLDNLRHPPGVETAASGTLGHVRKLGEGRRSMLLIPGLGFGDNIWTEFMERAAGLRRCCLLRRGRRELHAQPLPRQLERRGRGKRRLEFVTVPQSRLFIMYDQPEELERAIEAFLRRQGK